MDEQDSNSTGEQLLDKADELRDREAVEGSDLGQGNPVGASDQGDGAASEPSEDESSGDSSDDE